MNCKEIGIYVHIPFCESKCFYCDFVSHGKVKEEKVIREYIDSLLIDLEQYDLSKYNVSTIYIGGGTPSYINPKYIGEILEKIKLKANTTIAEITIEVNPGSGNQEKLEAYRSFGINRLSIGLQETDSKLLKQIGRIHTKEEFEETYNIAKNLGFSNVNVDLMIGLPNQNIENIKKSMEYIKQLDCNHVSVYSLIIEEGTVLEKQLAEGVLKEMDEELERMMYWYVKNTLENAGYNHYEISNFSKRNFESKHNMNCWDQKEYIGIGLAAHSYLSGKRFSNNEKMEYYIKNSTEKIILEEQNQSEMEKEYMLLGLRKIDGVSIDKFKKKFGKNPLFWFREEISRMVDEGLIEVELDKIKLTLKGIDFANIVWNEFV